MTLSTRFHSLLSFCHAAFCAAIMWIAAAARNTKNLQQLNAAIHCGIFVSSRIIDGSAKLSLAHVALLKRLGKMISHYIRFNAPQKTFRKKTIKRRCCPSKKAIKPAIPILQLRTRRKIFASQKAIVTNINLRKKGNIVIVKMHFIYG